MKIISGGQTGADQAALDAAIELRLEYGGWLPRGRKTEAGPLSPAYQMEEMPSPGYRNRTEKNILESEATLICSHGKLKGGSALTEALAIRHNKPCLHIDFKLYSTDEAVKTVSNWLREHATRVLNVAGPRASGDPLIYDRVFRLVSAIPWHHIDSVGRER